MTSTPYKPFSPVGRCIYCGSTDDLTTEHIIPYSLAGYSTLEKSSCKKCAAVTAAFEQNCARAMLGVFRVVYNFPTRRKKDRPKKLPLWVIKWNVCEKWDVPVEYYPEIKVLMPSLSPPKMAAREVWTMMMHLDPARLSPEDFAKMDFEKDGLVIMIDCYVPLADQKKRAEWLYNKGAIEWVYQQKVPLIPFSRMLAKIAHSYCVAQFGLGSFKPLLIDAILNGGTDINRLVGGLPHVFNLDWPFDQFHDMVAGITNINGIAHLACSIQLFSQVAPVRYLVIVGEASQAVVDRVVAEHMEREGTLVPTRRYHPEELSRPVRR